MMVARTLIFAASALALQFAAANAQAQGSGRGIPPGSKKVSSSAVPGGQKEKSFPELVKDRNARALGALGYMRCMSNTIAAAQNGRLGRIPQADLAVCVQEGNEWRGVFGQFDTTASGFKVRLQVVVPSMVATTSKIDTANVAATARAIIRAVSMPLPGDKPQVFVPVVLRNDVTYDIWFLPTQSNPANSIVGGDSLVQLNKTADREFGHTTDAPPTHVWSVVPAKTITLDSPQEAIPGVSEFMVANLALSVSDTVRVRTLRFEYTQARGSTTGWTFKPRVR